MPRGNKRRGALYTLKCTVTGCPTTFKSSHGRTTHFRSMHPEIALPHLMNPPALTATNNSPLLSVHSNISASHDIDYPDESLRLPPVQQRLARETKFFHPFLNATPCDINGNFLPEGTPPFPYTEAKPNDWTPYEDEVQFRTADLLYRKIEISEGNANELLHIWALSMMKYDDLGPYETYQDLFNAIDSTELGDVPWNCFKTTCTTEVEESAPDWKRQEYEIWYRNPDTVIQNLLRNKDFDGEFDTTPYVHLDKTGKRRWSDFMSGNFAWEQSDKIMNDNPSCEGAMLVPVILGSDKTTVSVMTGNIEYHPLYLSIGNVRNNVRRAHRNAVVPIGFLAIPKADRKYDNDEDLRTYKRKLYHASLSAILSTLKPAMTTPTVCCCPDGHYRRIIYELGPFIADYPEQVMLVGIVQGWCPKCTALSTNLDGFSGECSHSHTNSLLDAFSSKELWQEYGIDDDVIPFTCDFPRANIHKLLSSDLLHQVIKGTFKDHLVTWVGQYIYLVHKEAEGNAILDEIDRRIAVTPAFPCLRRFKQGRHFKQWTGDDSKALMKVYLPAIKDFVPPEMVRCLRSFLDFCYLVRRPDFDVATLEQVDKALSQFHTHREIFRSSGVRPEGFSLPRQHSLIHYRQNIEQFGAPGGLCSSITESRHITAVKKPWRRSNRYEALGQMLLTIQRLDKLAAARADFIARGMLPSERPPPLQDRAAPASMTANEDDDGGETDEAVPILGHVFLARKRERRYPHSLQDLASFINNPSFPYLVDDFLHDLPQSISTLDNIFSNNADPSFLPYASRITTLSVFHSAVATFHAPSDPSGIRGVQRERIRSTPSWRGRDPRRDCAFVVEDETKDGFRGMSVVRVHLFFSFCYEGTTYPCALVRWFKKVGRSSDIDTGMWIVEPEERRRVPFMSVIHVDSILRGAHLIPVYGPRNIPLDFRHSWSLDCFEAFYVNKFADHHANEIAW